jgi:carboxyl-terminal processing protease
LPAVPDRLNRLTRNATSAAKLLGVIAVLFVGIWIGGHPGGLPAFVRNALVANSHDRVISEALSDIQHDYYHPVSRSALIDNSIAGAVAGLGDPYANYETAGQFHDFNNPQPSKQSGVGISVGADPAGLLIQTVFPDTPASRADLHAGDVITAVDGHDLKGVAEGPATVLVRGKVGTRVTLSIARGRQTLRVTLTRENFKAPAVLYALTTYHGERIGVIDLPTFDIEGIHPQVAQALQSLLRQRARAIVLDLRDNGGGLVSEAQLVVSMFLRSGVIVTTRGRTQVSDTISATGNPIAPSIPLAVLVNGNTASAAEITSGALQDHHRAVIVGTRTYGKGVFQELRPLSNGGALDITVGQYYLPNGENLGAGGLRRGAGIKPNVTVAASTSATVDAQLNAALRILAAGKR